MIAMSLVASRFAAKVAVLLAGLAAALQFGAKVRSLRGSQGIGGYGVYGVPGAW